MPVAAVIRLRETRARDSGVRLEMRLRHAGQCREQPVGPGRQRRRRVDRHHPRELRGVTGVEDLDVGLQRGRAAGGILRDREDDVFAVLGDRQRRERIGWGSVAEQAAASLCFAAHAEQHEACKAREHDRDHEPLAREHALPGARDVASVVILTRAPPARHQQRERAEQRRERDPAGVVAADVTPAAAAAGRTRRARRAAGPGHRRAPGAQRPGVPPPMPPTPGLPPLPPTGLPPRHRAPLPPGRHRRYRRCPPPPSGSGTASARPRTWRCAWRRRPRSAPCCP